MKKRSGVKDEEVGNIQKKIFVIFDISKTKWKKRKFMATNYYWVHQHANLLVIVASHVSLAITSPWFKSVSKYDLYALITSKLNKQVQATLKPSKLNKSMHGVK